ncbi:MAG: hypothetical protein C0621_00700 [Desulfuromonas sp.]|nr:MAG: hypothetical protein C0621_00700 [Desulfuromonas sp.]
MSLADLAAQQRFLKNLLGGIIILFSHLRLYASDNSMVTLTSSRIFMLLDRYLADHSPLEIDVARHGFMLQGEFIDRSNHNFEKFASLLFMHGVARVSLHRGLAVEELHNFLRIFNRKPAETWDEGGIVHALEARGIEHIRIDELSDSHIQLIDGKAAENLPQRSDLWERFALSLFHSLEGLDPEGTGDEEVVSASELAQRASAHFSERSEEEKLEIVKEIGQFIVKLQHENIKIYRTQALSKITEFINNLSGEMRTLFLRNVFNLKLKADFAEGFYSGLSDEMILDALQNATLGNHYAPPMVLNLLGKLASSRELGSEGLTLAKDEAIQRAKELFRPDDFDKYVPASYQDVLHQIVQRDGLPGPTLERVEALKETLEEQSLDRQTSRILFDIMERGFDDAHSDGLTQNIDRVLRDLDARGDYNGLRRWYQLLTEKCADGRGDCASMLEKMHHPDFIATVLSAPKRFGKNKFDAIRDLIITIGEPFIAPLLDQLGGESNRAIRYLFIETLKGLGSKVVGSASGRLDDERWYFQRNIIYLLRELGDDSVLPLIKKLLRHSHPKVRFEAIKTALQFRDPAALSALLRQLDPEDRDSAMAALPLARGVNDPRVIRKLLTLLEHTSLLHYDLDLKRNVTAALAELGSQEALRFFRSFLANRNLLHPFDHEDLKVEIVKSLRRYPQPQVRDLLQHHAAGSSRSAQEATALLQKLHGETHEQ